MNKAFFIQPYFGLQLKGKALMRTIHLLMFTLLFSHIAFASEDVLNSADYANIKRPSGSVIVQYDESDSDYRFILGTLKKINGVLIREKEQNLNGRLYRITYKVPERFTPQTAFSEIDNQIKQMGGEVLFQCVSRACGSSNQWANKVFKYSRLYGFDQSQSFASYRLGNEYFSLYSVQRGNKQVYLRLEVLVTPNEEFSEFWAKGKGVAYDGNIEAIVDYLTENPSKSIWLVGRNHDDVSLQQQLDNAYASVEALKSNLIGRGIESTRVKLYSLGAFSFERDAEIFIYVE